MENDTLVNNTSMRRMSKEELCHLADNLFSQAVDANSYRCVLKQYGKNVKSYKEEMECSMAFYNIIYRALANSLVLLLSRIYDQNGNSLTIHNLLNGMKEMTVDDLAPQVREDLDFCDGKFQHQLKPIEEGLYEKEVQEQQRICEMFGYKYTHTLISISLAEYVSLYQTRFRKLKKNPAIRNLIEQRNRIIAHNDAVTNFDFKKITEDFPISNDDVEFLLDFAIDCTQFVRTMLTGVHTIPEYVNIDDWENSLELIRIGMKYKVAHLEDLVNEYFKESSS